MDSVICCIFLFEMSISNSNGSYTSVKFFKDVTFCEDKKLRLLQSIFIKFSDGSSQHEHPIGQDCESIQRKSFASTILIIQHI